MINTTKLIILRGPSASGKSTIDNKLRLVSKRKIALLDFDIYRNTFLNKQENYYEVASNMITNDALIALRSGFDVIIDGLYRIENTSNSLDYLFKSHTDNNYIFYFEISLEETIDRHIHRSKSKDFSIEKLKEWYYTPRPIDKYLFEYKIPQDLSINETVSYIRDITKI